MSWYIWKNSNSNKTFIKEQINFMDHSAKYEEIKTLIESNKTFTITTHVNPDGDGAGSEYALYHLLKKFGKDVRIINNNQIPIVFNFLEGAIDIFEEYDPSPRPRPNISKDIESRHQKSDTDVNDHDDWIINCDVIFVLDISFLERLGTIRKIIGSSSAKMVCIDHHIGNGDFADIVVSDRTACATAELIYDLTKYLGQDIEPNIAEALYTSILTDTEGFSLPNTTPKAFKLAAELMELGVIPSVIFENIYRTNTPQRIDLFRMALNTLKFAKNNKLAWIVVDSEMVKKSGAMREEMGGFIEYLMSIKSVEMAIFFLEVPNKGTKISIRSRGDIDSNDFAKLFEGGGHRHRAGIRKFNIPIEEISGEVIKSAIELF